MSNEEERRLLPSTSSAQSLDGGSGGHYGSADVVYDRNATGEGGEEDRGGEQPLLDAGGGDSVQTTGNTSLGCLATIQSRDSYHGRLLVCNILAIIFGAVTSGVLFLELSQAYGQCIIGMPLYPGGLLTRGVQRFWCRCPLYTIMLASTVPWIAIMINWVSDLFSKKCAYGKWLKWQAILTGGGTGAALCTGLVSALGFGNWCSRVIHSLDVDNLYTSTVTAPTSRHRDCYSAAVVFDTNFPDEFVKLRHTFVYTLIIMILQIFLIVFWVGSCYYSVRMWMSLPKDSFLAQMLLPPGIHPRGRRAEGHGDAIVTEQMTTIAAGRGHSLEQIDENHEHEA